MAGPAKKYKKHGTVRYRVNDRLKKVTAYCPECLFKTDGVNKSVAVGLVANHGYAKHDWNPFGVTPTKEV